MTKEEAIRIIETVFQDKYVYKYYDSITHQALNLAIEALKNEINCVNCVHYTERETYTGIKGVCKMDTAHREELQTEWLKAYCPTCANNDDRGTEYCNCQAEYEVEKDIGIACIHYEEYHEERE